MFAIDKKVVFTQKRTVEQEITAPGSTLMTSECLHILEWSGGGGGGGEGERYNSTCHPLCVSGCVCVLGPMNGIDQLCFSFYFPVLLYFIVFFFVYDFFLFFFNVLCPVVLND